MRIRLVALAVVAVVAAVPVLANVCDLSCKMAPRPAAPSSCHEERGAQQPAGGSHTPTSCSHDHDTMRAALKTQVLTVDAIGVAAMHATVHNSIALSQVVGRDSWRFVRSSLWFASPPAIPLRI